MKPYQFYHVERFPVLEKGKPLKAATQSTMFGDNEDIETELSLIMDNYETEFSLLRVKSNIKKRAHGYIKRLVGDELRQFEFNEFLAPVDFHIYLNRIKAITLFQASKDDSRGTFVEINKNIPGVELQEFTVDFGKVLLHHKEYLSAWFRKVSTRVTAANVTGDGIQNDQLFKDLSKVGTLSNVTIPWPFAGDEHQVMITARGGLVLVQQYKDALGFELRLIMDIYDKLLKKVVARKGGIAMDDDPGAP